MKAYLIYYTGDLDKISIEYIDESEDINKNRLYAITSSKKLLEEFLSIRDMTVFKVRKVDLLPSEYEDLVHSDLRKAVIDEYNIATKYNKFTTLAMTDYEYQMATDDYILNSMYDDVGYWKDCPDPLLFNKKIRKALTTLQYTQSYNLINCSDDEGYDAPAVDPDELQNFINNFAATLKET